MQRVHLVGLDFGTTTSSAIVATASVRRNAVNARMELSDFQELFRSDLVFTPFLNNDLDLDRIQTHLDSWLRQGNVLPAQLFGGGALLTGLAAQAPNAAALVGLIRDRLGNALIASADDPHLESWLAFMGSCAPLSRAHARQPFLNLDIGGGTTNLALGRGGEVLATDWLFIGARHVQVVPGSYRISKISKHGQALFAASGLKKGLGDDLSDPDVLHYVEHCLELLETVVRKFQNIAQDEAAPVLSTLTLSGGVGELVYRHVRGEPWPSTTAFGDLGIDLAKGLTKAPYWRDHWQRFQPEAGGRATSYGLLRHNTHVSGSTVFLPHPEDLPLRDLPILGTIAERLSRAQLAELIQLARRSGRGAGFRLVLEDLATVAIRALAERLSAVLRAEDYPEQQPLVLFVAPNVGKVLGQYITGWGAWPWHVLVIDEINCQNAQYAQIGAMRDQVIPVSFYGLNP